MAAANVRVNQILLRRGNTAAASTYTGPAGEVIVDTGLNTIRVQNGVTAGGTILATNAQVWSLSNSISTITGVDTSLLSNAATQQTQINTINANIGSYQIYANTAITALLSNAATQAQAIANAGGIYGNANVQTYLGSFDGNILPAANVTYSLGDATHQWKELWVSNNTIYIGGTPIRVVGGTLLVNNAPVSGAYGNTQVADYLLGNISTGNITPTSDVMVVGTGDAKLTLDSFNQAALLQAKKTFNRSFGEGDGASFVYSNVAGTGSITATITNDLYLKTLLERLSSQFSTPTPAFTYSYSNVRVQIYDVTNANVTANVTGVDNYGNPDEYTLLIDQPPSPDPFSVLALDISYDYLNTVGVDVDKDLFGITTDNDDIDIKSGRDIDLQARDDFFVSAGSQFIMTLNANDGQNPTDGIILETQANGTTRSWKYRFDGATEFASGLTAEPLSNYVPAPGTIIQQTAGELLQVLSSGEGAGMTVGWTDIPTSPSDLAVLSFNNVYGQVQVTTGNYATTTHTWSFTDSGNIIIPGNINYANGTSILSGLGGGSDIGNLQIDNNNNQLSFGPGESNSFLYMKNDGSETRLANDNGNVQISTIKQGPGGGTYYWTFDDTGNILLPNNSSSINYANGVSILSGIGGGTYGDANVTALLASNVSLIGSSSNITLATLGAGSTTTVSQEGGNPGVSGQGTITGASVYSPGFALVQPGWTVTGNNLVGTTTVTGVVEAPPGFYTITTDTAEVDPFWYQDVYTFTSNTPGYSNITVSSGNIISGTSQINFVANSSGDGYGFSTIELRPDTNAYDDSYLIIDPTYPSHIHIRAGGTQDNSLTQLFLGGENSHFRVDSGLNPTVYVRSNNNDWIFGNDGTLLLPRDVAGNTDPYLWITGGPTPSISSVDVSLAGPANFQIVSDYLNLSGYTGAKVAIKADNGEIATDANMVLTTNNANVGNTYSWTFDIDGNLTIPGSINGANVISASTFVSNSFNVVTAGNLSITSQYGLGFTGTILEDNGTLELIAKGGGAVVAGWDSTYGNGLGNIATINFNEVGGEGIVLRTGNRAATEYNWNFDNTGSLTFPTGGNLTFDSSAVSTIDGVTNIAASGTIGANVIQVLSDLTSFGASPAPVIYGFRSISTTGSAVNEGNISASGNLVASRDAYVTGNIFAASYNFANGVNILDTISGVTSISSVVNTSILSDVSGDYQYGTLDYSYAVNGNNGQFAIQYSFPLVYGNVDVNVGNVIASNVTTTNGIFWANGQAYSTGGGSYGNTEVAAYLPSYAGNLAASRAQVTNAIDFMYGGYPYMGWQLSGSDTLKLRTNIASGDYTHDAIIVDRQSLAVNVVAQLTAARVSTGNITITGNAVQQSAYYETYANVTNSGGNLTCNFVNGGTFYATLTGNVTANFTNVAVTTGTIVGATIIVDQGVTPYQVTNVQVNGGSVQQVKWAGGTGINVGTGSNTDVMSFSLINLGGGAWRVLGQIANYG